MRPRRWIWLLLAGYAAIVAGVFSVAAFAPRQWFSRDVPRLLIVFFGIYCVIMPVVWYMHTGHSSESAGQEAATDGPGDDGELPKTPLGWIAAIVAAIVLIAQITIFVAQWCARLLD